MPVLVTFFILSIIGTLFARQPDIDINRVKLISRDKYSSRNPPSNYHKRRSIVDISKYSHNNDFDDNSSGITWLRTPIQFQYDTAESAENKAVKVHKPREDPRHFYQSDLYLKEANRKNVNREVSSIYPGREVVRVAHDKHNFIPIRHSRGQLMENLEDYNTCIRCPSDRTLITQVGSDRVMLQYPQLQTCSGNRASNGAYFKHLYGPKFGKLLKQGSYIIVGQIIHDNQVLQTCKMQVHVLMQFCHIPKYLVARCEGEQNNTCSFICRDPKRKLQGHPKSTCGDDMNWTPNLAVCVVPTWCEPSPPPEHGEISCTGSTAENGFGLVEGSKCQVKCEKGWTRRSRNFSICRLGNWTRKLACRPKKVK